MKKGLRRCIALLLAVLLCCGCAGPAMAEIDYYNGINGNLNELVIPNIDDRINSYPLSPEGRDDILNLVNKILRDDSNRKQVVKMIKEDPSLSNLYEFEKDIFSDVNTPINISRTELERAAKYSQYMRKSMRNNRTTLDINTTNGTISIPNSLYILLEMDVSYFDFERLLLKQMMSISFPDHWLEFAKPTEAFSNQKFESTNGKNGEIFNNDVLLSEIDEYNDVFNTNGYYYLFRSATPRGSNKDHLRLQPTICYIVNGYACVFFNVAYYGTKTATINGISTFEVWSQKKDKIFVGGSTKKEYKKPIVLHSGEHTYTALIFDPGTWNDMKWVNEINNIYSSNATYNHYELLSSISNSGWES